MIPSTASPFRRLVLILSATAAFSRLAAQENPAVVLPDYVTTATRTPVALTTSGTSVDTVSAADLNRMQLTSMTSVLAGIPGAPTSQSGAAGGVTSLFLRGTNSSQTLFLVDGIRFSDPNTDYSATLGGMCVSGCDNLEVSHGPQSTLYGGEAVGGVVALRAQRGAGAAAGAVSAEAGSFGTIQGSLRAQGAVDGSAYNFSVVGGHTDNDRPNNSFDSYTTVLRLDHTFNPRLAIGTTYRGFNGRYGSPGDRYTNDLNNTEREHNQLATVFAEFTPNPKYSSRVVLGGQDRRYEAINPNAAGTKVTTTLVKNRRGVLDWQNTLEAGAGNRVMAGLTAEANHTRNTGFGNINESQQLLAFFVQDEWSPVERVYLTAGLRSDDADTFGRATTGRVTAAWLAATSRWKIRGSYGSAFRPPGFLDLYGQSSFYVGNPSLRPEKARGWDVGVDYFLADKQGVLGATWFDTQLTNLIVYDFGVFPGTTANVERAATKGLEVSGKFKFRGWLDVRLAYTYLEATNQSQGSRLLRRPRNSGTIDLWHAFEHGLSAGAGVSFVSGRLDVDAATFATIRGEDYTVARVYGAWQVSPRITLKARIENVGDERYEQVNGYPQPGFGAFCGMEYTF